MDMKTAIRIYRDAAAGEFKKPDKKLSYLRNDAMHLLSDSGVLLAVVHPGGECVHGAALNAAWRQFLRGFGTGGK